MKEYHITTFNLEALPKFAVGFERIFEELARTQEKMNNNNFPPYNIIRLAETEYAFEVAVAGYEERELTVEVVDGELIVRAGVPVDENVTEGEMKDPHAGNYLHRGIAKRKFTRAFALPENAEVKSATVRNGILTIVVEVFIPQSTKKSIAITFEK